MTSASLSKSSLQASFRRWWQREYPKHRGGVVYEPSPADVAAIASIFAERCIDGNLDRGQLVSLRFRVEPEIYLAGEDYTLAHMARRVTYFVNLMLKDGRAECRRARRFPHTTLAGFARSPQARNSHSPARASRTAGNEVPQ